MQESSPIAAPLPVLVVSLPPGLAGPQLYLQAVLGHPEFQRRFTASCWWTADVYRGLTGKWRLWRDARRWLRRVQPRVVYLVADLSLAFWLILMLKLAGAPAVVSHSHGARYRSPSHALLRRVFSLVLRWSSRHRLAVGADAAIAMYGSMDAVTHLPGLIDFRALRTHFVLAPPRSAGPLRIGCVGRLSAEKNQALLLQAVAALDAPGSLEVWLIGGGGDRATLQALTTQLGIGASVRFLGETTDMARIYAELDALAVPSTWEGQCRVAAEAQSLGLTVLVSPGVPDFALLPNPPARRIAGWAVADWAAALASLIDDPPPRRLPDAVEVDASGVALEAGVSRLCEILEAAA